MHVLLLSEGNTDVTLVSPDVVRGAVRVFLQRLIAAEIGHEPSEWEIEGAKLPRLHEGSGFRRKVRLAIAQRSPDADLEALAIVIDRDGPANSGRLGLLEEGREEAVEKGYRLAPHTALGVMVEMLEAWLLADTAALAEVVGISGAAADPESDPNPKATLSQMIGNAGVTVPEAYDQIAERADLSTIRQRCGSFERFASEVHHRLVQTGT